MLGWIEHQVAPTAFSVQLGEEDAVRCAVGEVELLADAADAGVTPGLRSGEYEPHLTAVFERYCKPGMTVVDVGANLGYYSLLASRLVGPSGRVVALEPNSENAASCCRRCGWAGSPMFNWCRWRRTPRRGGRTLDARRLERRSDRGSGPPRAPGDHGPDLPADDIVDGPIGFLKMDVEGAEGRIIRGATGLIERTGRSQAELKGGDAAACLGDIGGRIPGLLRGRGVHPGPPGAGGRPEKPYPECRPALLAEWGHPRSATSCSSPPALNRRPRPALSLPAGLARGVAELPGAHTCEVWAKPVGEAAAVRVVGTSMSRRAPVGWSGAGAGAGAGADFDDRARAGSVRFDPDVERSRAGGAEAHRAALPGSFRAAAGGRGLRPDLGPRFQDAQLRHPLRARGDHAGHRATKCTHFPPVPPASRPAAGIYLVEGEMRGAPTPIRCASSHSIRTTEGPASCPRS